MFKKSLELRKELKYTSLFRDELHQIISLIFRRGIRLKLGYKISFKQNVFVCKIIIFS